MAIERERKFLVITDQLPKDLPPARRIVAGYFTKDGVAIRVTIRESLTAPAYKVCFKSPGAEERQEFEYDIPEKDARELLELAPTRIEKRRFDLDGWEIDSFYLGGRQLWTAEWEEAEGKPPIPEPLPNWIGVEVTDVREFSNQQLAWKYGRNDAANGKKG